MKINYLGIPTNTGALYSGTEMTPQLFREALLLERLNQEGAEVVDYGDLVIPDYLPRHNTPPIRNYPGPRLVWELVASKQYVDLFKEDDFTLIVGGDCSIIVGTVNNLMTKFEDVHLVVLDAHVDDVAPSSEHCVGAAAMGLWVLTNESMLWNGSILDGSQITVVGAQDVPKNNKAISTISLKALRKDGILETANNLFRSIPPGSKIFIHFDVDVLMDSEMPCAYSPSIEGFLLSECGELINTLMEDRRVIGMEITEFSGIKATTKAVGQLRDMIINGIKKKYSRIAASQ